MSTKHNMSADRSLLRVNDPTLADLLRKPLTLRYLSPFLGQERSTSQAARDIGVGIHTLMPWVKRFVGLGLLEVSRSEKRAGKAIKWYTATHPGYFIPFASLPAGTLEDLLAAHDAQWNQTITENLVAVGQQAIHSLHTWGIQVHQEHPGTAPRMTVSSGGETSISDLMVSGADSPAVLACWLPLQLSFEEAKQFQRDLHKLIGLYAKRRGGQRYLARIALTPVVS
jgi:hypothetical protein